MLGLLAFIDWFDLLFHMTQLKNRNNTKFGVQKTIQSLECKNVWPM